MLHPLEAKLAESWPPAAWSDVTVLIGVSGGSDSVALLRALAALKSRAAGRICVAHFNHRLRPAADDDEQFVAALCRQLEVSCEIGRAAENLGKPSGKAAEASARTARYRFLQRTAGKLGARYVVTAHTANDQAETILHHILRGTGLRGLSGIQRARPFGHATLIRPMLAVHRIQIVEYLRDLQQPYRHDESNQDVRYTRNRIRHKLLPRLQRDYNPQVVAALLRLGALAGDAQTVIDAQVDQLFERGVLAESRDRAEIALAAVAGQSPYLVSELLSALWRRQGWPLQAMGQLQWDELTRAALAGAPPVHQVFPGDVRVEVDAGRMRITRRLTE